MSGIPIMQHLVFYIDGKSMRVRTDINVLTDACSIHRTYTLFSGSASLAGAAPSAAAT